jgi:hypothetical protein
MKKTLLAVAAAGALTALTATSAMAFENEFHGMYKFMGFYTNFFNGDGAPLREDIDSGFFAEQRARLQYTAKANDDLKLVTHFELDSRFGGKSGTYLGAGNDAGNLDADQLTFETKNVYLDFNCPITKANVKVGLQPWADSYQSLFLLADMTGVYVTKKYDPLTLSLGWFRFDDDTVSADAGPGDQTSDLLVFEGKYAANKDMKFGLSYYGQLNDSGTTPAATSTASLLYLNREIHTVGLNADMNFGGFNLKPFAAYQTGEVTALNETVDSEGWLAGAVGKVKTGNGAVNFTAIYLSGDDDTTDDDLEFWQPIFASSTYFNPANMWLLVRNGQQINSSTSVLGNDLTVGGRGLFLATVGYEGTAGKMFYNVNAGYGQTAEERNSEDGYLGCELNAQVGYKLFDNLTASVAGAYMALGDGLNDKDATKRVGGAADADDPYMVNVQLSYVF